MTAMPPKDETRRLLRGREAALARNMEASLTVPTASTVRTFEVGELMAWRARMKKAGRSPPIAAVLACAIARTAALEVPAISRRAEGDGSGLVVVSGSPVNLGVAIDVESAYGHSVLVPVLKEAAALRFPELVDRLSRLAAACRAGAVAVADLQGATLVMTSTGKFGSSGGVPRLPKGPGAIIAAGSIGVPAGLERLAITHAVTPVLTLTSTYDHRVIQGADSGEFLAAVQRRLQSPTFLAELERELVGTAADQHHDIVRVAEADPWETFSRSQRGPVRARGIGGAALPDGLEVEFAHLADPSRREWFRRRMSSATPVPLASRRLQALRLASDIDVFETYLQKQFLGHKTLSVEGLEASVIVLAEIAGRAASRGASDAVVGMGHRGRLSIMALVMRWPLDRLLSEFLPTASPSQNAPAGDVHQHLGGDGTFADVDGCEITVSLEENPSHLEFVSPVALGSARAHQDVAVAHDVDRVEAQQRVVPVLLHGDAAFTGQGVVYETLNMHKVEPYDVGGTVHIVQDNRLGFTATATDLRSTPWPSDVARGFEIPVLHTDADDLDANLIAAQIAIDYRSEFGSDVIVHVQGYRRHGHNETDEPRYTQPLYYADIASHRPVYQIFGEQLTARGVAEPDYLARTREELSESLAAALRGAREGVSGAGTSAVLPDNGREAFFDHASPAWCVTVLDEAEADLIDFTVHPKLLKQFDRRRLQRAVDNRVDWGQAELLALKLVNEAGVAVRLTGEDVERGTFSHRHLVIHDASSGARRHRLTLDDAPFLVANTPLSEVSTVGFEYGYGRTNPRSLQVWEAQFGDFANVAQVIFDQFVTSGRDKWGRDGRLVLLLPHGWEGAGPEHSSARMERFLQQAARENMRVLVPSNAAQYFAGLVHAALGPNPLPYVIFTPKSLLRAEAAKSPVEEFAPARFRPVIANGAPSAAARRIVMCAGKVAVEVEPLLAPDVRLLRFEQLYPFPLGELRAEILAATDLEDIVWLQEEPENMGGWRHVSHAVLRAGMITRRLGYVGRPEAASPAEGYPQAHKRAQSRLLAAASDIGAADYWLSGGQA